MKIVCKILKRKSLKITNFFPFFFLSEVQENKSREHLIMVVIGVSVTFSVIIIVVAIFIFYQKRKAKVRFDEQTRLIN
jgi:hypothetical protein